ncbi:DUF1634 domain-containing protein [Mucilaginibacter terrae]|uniref:Membrane protein n=1 Tax=Mucilaginibacter terrae TaxID=1955052 RepID=A0ABU3GVU7_9SPHI|nr:DUF1634 domain-containing protein [Mucilaginibacter terrae]MDT3402755.1 putative membrane protein [Mucilaginibacter terrae]
MPEQKHIADTDIQQIIGWILRLGVIISMGVVFVGGCVYLYRHGYETVHYGEFVGIPGFVHSASGIWHGIITFRGRAIIQAGIILLIATPVIRILFSAIGFVLEKDWLYTGITLLVLFIIVASALTGHAG